MPHIYYMYCDKATVQQNNSNVNNDIMSWSYHYVTAATSTSGGAAATTTVKTCFTDLPIFAKLLQDKNCALRTLVELLGIVEAGHYRLDVHPNNSVISLEGIAAEVH